ncbi:hypothetical protein CSB09_04055 [Candidatus Gracilibacteria bacterium]|nr:MAG: hypothetical protein CSB09_04055 [Candidatus Gracilibacteria bacterium]
MRKHQYLETICKVCDCNHRTAEDIFLEVQKTHPKVGKATIYRNLESLAEEGKLRRVPGLGGKTYYECNIAPHAHLINDAGEYCTDFPIENIKIKNIPEGFEVTEICVHITPKIP